GRTEERYLFVDGAPERQRRAGGTNDTTGLFAASIWRLGDRTTLSTSGRVDLWSLRGGYRHEREIDGDVLTDEGFAERRGAAGTARIGMDSALSRAIRLRSAVY